MSHHSTSLKKQYWAIVPAAGVGKRMQADRPKQYLSLCEKTVIEQTLDKLFSVDEISGVVLAISDDDAYWSELKYKSEKPLYIAQGGGERSDSVLNSLLLLNKKLNKKRNEKYADTSHVWVLVHDAARPCVRHADILKLINTASVSDNGGLLALPVRDTMKRSKNNNQVDKTVSRDGLWHALTPQMFRLDLLMDSLNQALNNQQPITDDASAMELAGFSPLLVEGHEDNIKITRSFDLQLAELYLKQQSKQT